VTLLLVTLLVVVPAVPAQGAPMAALNAGASCAALSARDHTATNGSDWGRTIYPGHGAANGWFGVDVCDNGINAVSPNGANVSCDRVPTNWSRSGCTPGSPTTDGFGWTFQCVELVARFSAWAFDDSPGGWSGNAPDLWLPANHPSDFVMYPNGSSTRPVPGDVLVWGSVSSNGQPWPAGPDGEHGGHVAVVAAVNGDVVTTVEQNVKWGTQDHPSDRLALTHVGSRWILSGSIQQQTTLPTYRWRSTMGTARATYGWLHSTKNIGRFPSTSSGSAKSTPPAAKSPGSTSTPAPRDTSGGLPALTPAALVVTGGALADLTWSTADAFSTSPASLQPRARARSLGAPLDTSLAAGQTPAVVVLPSGARYVYVIGTDGDLYCAYTAPNVLGVVWTDLGAPPDHTLQPQTAATTFAGGAAVAALADDGSLWWRAGPAGMPGDWQPLGHPDSTVLFGGFALAGAPGSGAPLALALGGDGLLYERVWQLALLNDDGTVQVPAGWSDWLALHAQPAGVLWTGKLLAVPETTDVQNWVGSWPDVPLDVLVLDGNGHLWRLRSASGAMSWTTVPISAPAALTGLVAATVVPAAPAAQPAQPAQPAQAAQASQPGAQPTPGAQNVPAAALHVYGLAANRAYLGSLPLVMRATATDAVPAWTRLPDAAADAVANPAGVALALGPGTSALALVAGNELRVAGSIDGLQALLPDVSTSSPSMAVAPAWYSLGAVVSGSAFNDPLTASVVNADWSQLGAGAKARPGGSGLSLVPGQAGVAALLQQAAPGDTALTVQLAIPTHLDRATKAGLVLYLDDGDWLTLVFDGSGQASMCVTAGQAAAPCTPMPVVLSAKTTTLWLRVERRGELYSGETSIDGTIWHAAGQWHAALPDNDSPAAPAATAGATATVTPGTPSPPASATRSPVVTSTPGPTPPAQLTGASPAAPLAFTAWGLWLQGTPGKDTGIRFLSLNWAPEPLSTP
jgi:hypothetical protein